MLLIPYNYFYIYILEKVILSKDPEEYAKLQISKEKISVPTEKDYLMERP